MKLFLVLVLLKLCNCEFQLPDKIFDAKDVMEAEGNRKSLENLMKIAGIHGEKRVEGKKCENESAGNFLIIFYSFLYLGRVTGGELAYIGQFPYQALVFMQDFGGAYVCGGSLITYRTVLTVRNQCNRLDSVQEGWC